MNLMAIATHILAYGLGVATSAGVFFYFNKGFLDQAASFADMALGTDEDEDISEKDKEEIMEMAEGFMESMTDEEGENEED